MHRFAVVSAAVACLAVASPGIATAANLIDRNATGVRLAVNAKGEALLTYLKAGRVKHVLVWGAVDAAPPRGGMRQVEFKLDYAGGYGKYRTAYWKTFGTSCGRYDGPPLTNVVAACKAPDGSYWAAQSWGRPLPNLGFAPWTAELRAKWLEVSHWTELAVVETGTMWLYSGRFQSIFGRFLYRGEPVYGFGTTRFGAPTDGFGRLIYLDTFNSTYGPGWLRENSFVPHNPTGVFCYGFYSFDPTKGGYKYPPGETAKRGPGTGEQYRLTFSGPGVTPNVEVTVPGLHPFDRSNPNDVSYQQAMAARLAAWGDKSCRAGV
jgi:hypothetical protein